MAGDGEYDPPVGELGGGLLGETVDGSHNCERGPAANCEL